jgi:peptidoglycan-associated lipoprotein
MSTIRHSLLGVGALVLLGVLGGCADKGPGSYVVLLRDPDGNLGKVAVKTPQGEQVLAQTFKGTALNGSKEPFFVMQDQLKRDFGAAMAAMPPPIPPRAPLRVGGGSRNPTLPPETIDELRKIADEARRLNTMDITVTGHTDTVGKPDENAELGLARAKLVVKQLRDFGLKEPIKITPKSDGQYTQKVTTGDQVAEPANRRVEVILH